MTPPVYGGIGRTAAGNGALSALAQRYGPVLAVAAVALALRAIFPVNADVSWLITIGEKVLQGERPYIDFVEVNPPASILLYLPAVALARALHVSPEFAVGTLVFAAAGVALWFAHRIVKAGGLFSPHTGALPVVLFAAVLLILPAKSFGQREHIALIAFLPALAVYAVRSCGKPVALHYAVLAGIGAGFTAVIKPHLLLAPVFAAVAAAISVRSWRPLFAAENLVAAAVCIAYAGFVFAAYPAFVAEALPLVAAVYVPVREPLMKLLTYFATPIFVLTLAITFLLIRSRAFAAPFVVLIAAAAGFAAAFYAQQKGWPYHSYPMLALALAGVLIAFGMRWHDTASAAAAGARTRRLASALGIALLAAAAFFWLTFGLDTHALREAIAKSAPRPRVIAITSDIGIGHPLTRVLNGRWVGRVCSQWIATGAMILKNENASAEAAARLDRYIARDRAMLTEDIRGNKPDIILVDRMRFDWLKWANEDPALARELAKYRPLETVNGILILRR